MDQPWITVKRKDDRFVRCEQRVEVAIRQPMRVLGHRLQLHQVHHVNHADLQLRRVLTQQFNRGQRLQRGHVATARHHHVRPTVAVIAGPFPDAKAGRAMPDRLIHRQPLRRRLLPGNHYVDVVAAAQAVVSDRQQAVRIGWQIDAHHFRLLVDDVVDEARILMAEPVRPAARHGSTAGS